MASSNNNITALHFSLIFFVMLSIILGVVSYKKINDATEAKTAAVAAAKKESDATTSRDTASDTSQGLFRLIGFPFAGPDIDENARTQITKQIKAAHEQTVSMYVRDEWLNKHGISKPGNLREDLYVLAEAYKRERADRIQRVDEMTRLKDAAEAARAQAETARAKVETMLDAEKQKITAIEKDYKEKLDDKQDQINQANARERQLNTQIAAEREAHANEIAVLERKNTNLVKTIQRQQQIIDELKQVSFERADGVIRQVDYRTKLVWIDLGTADRLPDRLTFSVYSAAHHGIGRGREDIKGAIEVTKISGSHMAQARIVDYDIYNPIRAGDPIYTPLWTPGAIESFAFVGFVDLDGDGKDDWDVMQRMLKSAKAKISNWVDDKGVRHGTGLTTEDKFLVVGKIFDPSPDPSNRADQPKNAEDVKTRLRIAKAKLAIEEEARENGVRILSMRDFLVYIGHTATRRLWRPGEGTPRKLKAGAASTTVDEVRGDRSSSGRTSGIYSRSKRLKQPKSSGQTSGAYR